MIETLLKIVCTIIVIPLIIIWLSILLPLLCCFIASYVLLRLITLGKFNVTVGE